MKKYSFILFFVLVAVSVGSSLYAGEFQDCSGRGVSIQGLIASTRYCNHVGGNTTEAVLLQPPPVYRSHPSMLGMAAVYDTTSLFMGSKWAPVAAYYYMLGNSSVNPSVYYQSHQPIIYAPYSWR